MSVRFLVLSVLLGGIFLIVGTTPAVALKDYGQKQAAEQAGLVKDVDEEPQVAGQTSFFRLVGTIIKAALSFLGIVFFGLVLYAGFLWMRAMGNTEHVTKAKEMLESAVIGLVLILSAYALANFVFERLTGVSEGGGASGPAEQIYACKGGDDDKQCGNSQYFVCAGGSCVPKCEAQFKGKNPECIEKSKCALPRTTTALLCPERSATIQCCHD